MEAAEFPNFGAPYLRILTLIFPGLKCIKSVCSWIFEITKKIHIKVFTEKSYSQKTWFFDLQQAKSGSNSEFENFAQIYTEIRDFTVSVIFSISRLVFENSGLTGFGHTPNCIPLL